jgi:hypothetical protein
MVDAQFADELRVLGVEDDDPLSPVLKKQFELTLDKIEQVKLDSKKQEQNLVFVTQGLVDIVKSTGALKKKTARLSVVLSFFVGITLGALSLYLPGEFRSRFFGAPKTAVDYSNQDTTVRISGGRLKKSEQVADDIVLKFENRK